MEPKISVLMPSIRVHLLEEVYKSIEQSFHDDFELIIVGPYPLPTALKDKANIIYIKDDGTPIRARQLGLIAAKGKYICYAADDVLFYPQSLDIAYNTIYDKDYKTIVLGKYLEGSENNPFMRSNEYYLLKTHDFLKDPLKNVPYDYKLLNTGLISTELMKEIGGFDCSFECCAMACVDLSVRLQNYGANIIIQDEPFFKSTHLPVGMGDHQPIHNAQISHDQPLFILMYTDPRGAKREKIDIDNWKDSASWWTRRFGKQETT